MNETRYYVDIRYACYMIIINNGVVKLAPPIAEWMIGKNESFVLDWLNSKRAKVIKTSV